MKKRGLLYHPYQLPGNIIANPRGYDIPVSVCESMVSGSEELAVSRTASKEVGKARKNFSQGESGGEVKGGTP